MKSWDKTYQSGLQFNNLDFPEQFLVKIFFDPTFRTRFELFPDKKILDLGCGFGRNISLFQKFTSNIHCCDPSGEAIQQVKQRWDVDISLLTPPKVVFDNLFDLIVACNSIYYLDSNFTFEQYLVNILSFLKEKGLIILSFIGKEHSILAGASFQGLSTYKIHNLDDEKYIDREGQLIFVPADNFSLEKFGLKILLEGEIKDIWGTNVRHLKIFLCEKNAADYL